MTPIDDELRSALQRRATGVAPSPDPLAGIERRAGRMRRNRLAASVAGSVLAVAAVATAVPLLTGPTVPQAPPVALTPPSAAPTGAPTASPPAEPSASYELRVAAPWAYRGTPLADLGTGTVETVRRELAVRRGVAEDAVALTPLWGQVWEPSGQPELVYLAVVDGEARWGFARATESGPELAVDEQLPEPPLALAAALPGDEVSRLVVVAAPTVGALEYGPDAASEYAPMAELAPGVGTTSLEGEPASATYRVLDGDGGVLLRAAVPAVAGPDGEPAGPPLGAVTTPTNVVDWPLRGEVPEDQERAALARAADTAGVPVEQVAARMLFGAERDGRFYGMAQVWFGGDAQLFTWAADVDDPAVMTAGLSPPTPPGPAAFGEVFDDVLVVVPEPRTGQVLYAPDADSEPVAVPDQGTEAAVLIERPLGTTGDRLLVLDGNGDPDRPVFRGSVDELLAAS